MAGSVPPNPLLLGSAVHIPADMAYELMMERQLEVIYNLCL